METVVLLSKGNIDSKRVKVEFLKIQLFHSGGIFHDRYIILDYGTSDEKIFLCGASSKDAGGRITSILEDPDRKKYESMIKDLLKNKQLVLK